MTAACVIIRAEALNLIIMSLIISASVSAFSEPKEEMVDNSPCCNINFETSWKQVAKDLLNKVVPRIDALIESEDERSALKEEFLTTGPAVVIDIIVEGGLREPMECLPLACRDIAKIVVFRNYLESMNDEVLHNLASDRREDAQDESSASKDAWENDIEVMQAIQVDLGEQLSPELLAQFNECLRKTFWKNEATSTRALFHIKDTDKVLSEDEISKISEAVGEEYSKVWLQQVLCPTVDYDKLKGDARKNVTADCRGKVSDTGWSIAEKLLFEDDESKNDSK